MACLTLDEGKSPGWDDHDRRRRYARRKLNSRSTQLLCRENRFENHTSRGWRNLWIVSCTFIVLCGLFRFLEVRVLNCHSIFGASRVLSSNFLSLECIIHFSDFQMRYRSIFCWHWEHYIFQACNCIFQLLWSKRNRFLLEYKDCTYIVFHDTISLSLMKSLIAGGKSN